MSGDNSNFPEIMTKKVIFSKLIRELSFTDVFPKENLSLTELLYVIRRLVLPHFYYTREIKSMISASGGDRSQAGSVNTFLLNFTVSQGG